MIEAQNKLTSSIQNYHYFDNSNNNDTTSLQPVIKDLRVTENIICECCGIIGHKYD